MPGVRPVATHPVQDDHFDGRQQSAGGGADVCGRDAGMQAMQAQQGPGKGRNGGPQGTRGRLSCVAPRVGFAMGLKIWHARLLERCGWPSMCPAAGCLGLAAGPQLEQRRHTPPQDWRPPHWQGLGGRYGFPAEHDVQCSSSCGDAMPRATSLCLIGAHRGALRGIHLLVPAVEAVLKGLRCKERGELKQQRRHNAPAAAARVRLAEPHCTG